MNSTYERCAFDDLLLDARLSGASDVHLAMGRRPMLRIDGSLRTGLPILFDRRVIAEAFERLATPAARTSLTQRGDASFVVVDERWGRARLHWSQAQSELLCTVRLLATSIPDADEIGVPRRLQDLSATKSGLLAIVGPTGSGKSTTLAALLRTISTQGCLKIVALDDPIEFDLSSLDCTIEQRVIGTDVTSLDDAILSALRSDPDVIAIGEVRSVGDVRSLLRAAETGHLVITTLHANDAAAAIDRFIRCFPGDEGAMARSVLADVLIAVCAQRLIVTPPRGRALSSELLIATDAIRAIVRDGKSHQLRNAMTLGAHAGMTRFTRGVIS